MNFFYSKIEHKGLLFTAKGAELHWAHARVALEVTTKEGGVAAGHNINRNVKRQAELWLGVLAWHYSAVCHAVVSSQQCARNSEAGFVAASAI